MDVLRVLADADKPQTGNEIGYALGLEGPMAYKGWHGTAKMGPAQRVIGCLNGLRARGLIDFGARPDGWSGTAYYITEAGRTALAERED